jgi:hypothetical protein
VRCLSKNLAKESGVTRGSRTRNRPEPIRNRSFVIRTLNSLLNERNDQPSVTFALMPSAAMRKRTAYSERPSRWAIFFAGS